ncbi:hypothetical protein [Alicyclobacillus sp. SO9]|uniref:hypothetical protein n=1 Tax=Alicyclobacillus sp. SO9 TaxID=2665646 RepID=UPI0018E8C8CC|nr:hypothetical protein [Alicyclobacillus sp. SO9]QQE77397.1 hypothetical protein GI364_15735 [Alicyclobacillus sp. SO9]
MYFKKNSRLLIELPDFATPFERMSSLQQEEVLVEWARIKAQIPDKIKYFEDQIRDLLDDIHHEENWDVITNHFQQITDYASRINELNLWSRVDPDLHPNAPSHFTDGAV